MLKLHRYIFYRLYCWLSNANSVPPPAFGSLMIMSVVQAWNVLLLLEILQFALGHPVVGHIAPWEGICFLVLIMIPQYFLLVRGNKVKTILEEFKFETRRR